VNNSSHRTRDEFDCPATYRIRVSGWVGDEWVENLSGMQVADIMPEGGRFITTLEGEMRDQAALVGMINALYVHHLPVLSVQRLSRLAPGN
jgi:hypothetical protein